MSSHPARLGRSARVLLGLLSRLHYGRLELLGPGGQSFSFPGALPGPDAVIHLQDWEVASDVLRAGQLGFAEAYLQGRWHTPDLPAVLTLAALNRGALAQGIHGRRWSNLVYRLRQLLRANTRAGARRNIHAHYDLGNDFYRRWLDQTMTYSSAAFDGEWSRSLEDAQTTKYERIVRLVNPRPGECILEIGCGWGGFAEYAARTRGCRVHGITVSRKQLPWAQERIRRAGLEHLVTLEFRDYRDVQGSYDHVVSIEMYEAVGERYWRTYFATLARALAPGRSAMIQAITIDERLFERYRTGTDFIQQYIFPGGMLATPARIREEAARAGLEVTQAEPFGADYAETLRRWRHQFTAELPAIHALGYPESFIRMWEFYLAYCEAGFATRCTDVYHFQLSRSR